MPLKYPPINPKFPRLWHGGDYNPDQWLAHPEIIDEDFRLMELAGCNTFSVGIFAWTALEPEEGKYTFDWLDAIMDRLAAKGYAAVLATPSGARPAWMAFKYPEVRRVDKNGLREPYRTRHNHCPTSPIYRQKVSQINRELAERYKNHKALAAWHLSNEYNGECFCDLCKGAFRKWLKNRYGSLENLNQNWWSAFWSHTFTDFNQIDMPDSVVDCMMLDWKRFVTDQTIDFIRNEAVPLKELTPDTPVTTNLMGTYNGLNYHKLAEVLDVASDDTYPNYDDRDKTWESASYVSMVHDLMRGLKGGRPYIQMETTPSTTNWSKTPKIKRPGAHLLEMLQTVAHGADTTMYFQWRKGRGCSEKFHGAVVDHAGHEHTRVFNDVAGVGRALPKLAPIIGCGVQSQVAFIYDWEARWALETSGGPRHGDKEYVQTCHRHYIPFWRQGISVDVVGPQAELGKYKLVVAPMLYLLQPGLAERLESFVKAGGTLVTTYLSGIVDESNRCFLGGWPGGGLRKLLGVWAEEIDCIYDDDVLRIKTASPDAMGLSGEYAVNTYADLIHAEGSQVLAVYGDQFYAGRPALTVNQYGDGEAYYIAARTDDRFLLDFYTDLMVDLSIPSALDADLPEGVTAQTRTDGQRNFIFLMNFRNFRQTVDIGTEAFTDMLTGNAAAGSINLDPYGIMVLTKK